MFICTLKASNIKFFAIVLSAVALLVTLVAITSESASDALAATAGGDTSGMEAALRDENELAASAAPEAAKISFENVRSNDDRIKFLRQFGWEVESEPLSEAKLKLPAEFDGIMNEYNEIQKSQGLDLSKYKGNEVERYSYAVTNYPGYEGEVVANVIVVKSRVVAGDVCSADPDGFIGSLYRPDGKAPNVADTTAADGEPSGANSEPTSVTDAALTLDMSAEPAEAPAEDTTAEPAAAEVTREDAHSADAEAAREDAQPVDAEAPWEDAQPVDAEAPWDGSPEIGDAAYSGNMQP